MSNSALEEMERGAKRLLSDAIEDSDSIDGLLAGMETDDDDFDEDDYNNDDNKAGGSGGVVTQRDLEFLAAASAKLGNHPLDDSGGSADDPSSDGRRVGILADTEHTGTSGSILSVEDDSESGGGVPSVAKKTKKQQLQRHHLQIDEIGNRLLSAKGNPEEESRILRKSLNLGRRIPVSVLNARRELEEGGAGGHRDDDDVDDDEGNFGEEAEIALTKRVSETTRSIRASLRGRRPPEFDFEREEEEDEGKDLGKMKWYLRRTTPLCRQVTLMVSLMLFVMLLLALALFLGTMAVGPPRQPVGEYKIVEAQVGHDLFSYYDFYSGRDSAGSNGFQMYVGQEVAKKEGIIRIVREVVTEENMIEVYEDGEWVEREEDWLKEDMDFLDQLKRKKEMEADEGKKNEDGEEKINIDEGDNVDSNKTSQSKHDKVQTTSKKQVANRHLQINTSNNNTRTNSSSSSHPPPKLEPFNPDLPSNSTTATTTPDDITTLQPNPSDLPTETFVILSSSPSPQGPRNSIRLEGHRRFNRGLFIIDLRHMPAGCGTWPAFWLTDEANWPVNGEIDIVEGVNYQDTAKTALHSTKECRMDDVPEGSKTGSWDTAVGIPDKKTGIPDMTFRYAQDCFVYDPHQWLNQGCVATDLKLEGRSLGVPLNGNGGGVYALEWDPINGHIRTWVFSPHGRVPKNLRDAMRTATEVDEEKRVAPDTNLWGLPYGHFPIGDGTNCPADHFRNMRLVINLAFCGSVSGNRYFMDCPKQFKKFKTCNEWVASDPDELKEAYWKIRGVYVYERAWEKQWYS